jgi:hypothetical protein
MPSFDSIQFQSGRPLLRELSADRLNSIITEIRRNKPKGERGITVRQDGTGTYIGLAASQGKTTSVAVEFHPFQISTRQNPENEDQYLATVRPGTINTLLPTNTFDGSSLTEHSYSGNQLRYVVLTASATNSQFTSCSISIESSAPAAQTPTLFATPTEYKVLIGIVRNTSIYQIVFDNIVVSGKQHYVKDRASAAAPGFLPYEIYFVWGL